MAGTLNLNEIALAIITGFVPSIIWLIFWLKRDRGHHQPRGLFATCFFLGAALVIVAGYLEKVVHGFISDMTIVIIAWTAIEEVLKFCAAYFVGIRSRFDIDAIDPAMYMMTAALGFAAVENVLYVLQPLQTMNITASLLTGGLRFFGSTLLHAIASGFVGITIALSPKGFKMLGGIFGLLGAIALHSTFNFFILKDTAASFLQIYGYLWVAAIISYLILEKLRRIPSTTHYSPLPVT